MTSIEPVRERSQADSVQADTSVWNKLIYTLEKLDRATRASAAATLKETAALIDTIAVGQDKIGRLLHSMVKIENIKTREAAFEALGFEHDVAVAFGIKTEQGFPIFKNGVSAMHKRKPVTVAEARFALLTRVHQLRIMARVYEGSSMGESIEERRVRSSISRLAGNGATVAWDLASYGKNVLGPLGSIALAAASETENDMRWEFEKLISLTPAATIQDLENARADYLKGYALNRIGIIISALPGSGTATKLLGAATGDGRQEVGRDLSLYDLIREAAGR